MEIKEQTLILIRRALIRSLEIYLLCFKRLRKPNGMKGKYVKRESNLFIRYIFLTRSKPLTQTVFRTFIIAFNFH